MSFQPSRRQLLNIKKKLHTSISIFITFFKSGNYQIWKKKTCSLLPVLRDSFGCRYGLTMRLTNCCFNEQSASHVCMTEKVWSSIIFFLLLRSFFRLPKKKDGELKMSWYILTENQSVALPFYLENTNH